MGEDAVEYYGRGGSGGVGFGPQNRQGDREFGSPQGVRVRRPRDRTGKGWPEIVEEVVEAFDPSMPLLARLGWALRGSSFTGDELEILSKIRKLRRRYEEKCYKIRVGAAMGGFNVAAFNISNRIWGGGITGTVTKKRKKKRNSRRRR